MLATLGVFFAPYMTLHVLSLNLPAASDYLHDSAVVYYMNLLPYFKFISDPIIYGMRMREVKVGILIVVRGCCALLRSIGDCLCVPRDDENLYEMTTFPTNWQERRRIHR